MSNVRPSMQIGSPPRWLVLAPATPVDSQSPWAVEAHAQSVDFTSVVRHSGVFPLVTDETLREFESFSSFARPSVEIALTEDGWLRLTRTPRGYIDVQYRLHGSSAQASAEGTVMVEGELAASVCAALAELLNASR